MAFELFPTEKQKMKKFLTWLHLFLAAISFNSWIQRVLSGHEVLHGFPESQLAIKRDEIAIIQYDSRPLGNYWNVTARWNREYSRKNGHKYYYFSQKTDYCVNGDVKLGAPWCKVRAMIAADKYIQDSKMIIFLDSDALVTANYSMDVIISYIKKDLYWNWREKPVVFNQDGPGFACKHAIFVNYGICLNSGVVLWMKGDLSTKILNEWWDSSGDFLNGTNFRMNWKLKWPWEQAKQYEIYNKYKDAIQIFSFPKLKFLPWTSRKNPRSQYPTDFVEPWCFTHWPGANCFITHYCASTNQKYKMRRAFDVVKDRTPVQPLFVEDIQYIATRRL